MRKIKQNSALNNWEEFEYRFSNVHESFYEKLNKFHPDLSTLDKRICALLKLNLSTKEIANLTKTSIKSVENTRTRLRKKLGLTHTDKNLSSYLSEL
jgi:DNA-binding NarL/FixJ family response regulator